MWVTSNRYLVFESVQHDYPELLQLVRDTGDKVSPRGQPTRELLDVTVTVDPYYPLATAINRGISSKLISLEALMLISGLSYPERTVAAVPEMRRFMTGGAFHGAYGPRIRHQLQAVVDRLRADPDSRQAVMTIWDPAHDLFGKTVRRDVPCTALLQFLYRNQRLSLHVTMRSNDVWWGFPHDIGQFTQLQLAVARILNVRSGRYHHHAVSLHLYTRDVEKIDQLTTPNSSPVRLTGIGHFGASVEAMQARAQALVEHPDEVDPCNPGEVWHVTQQRAIDLAIATGG